MPTHSLLRDLLIELMILSLESLWLLNLILINSWESRHSSTVFITDLFISALPIITTAFIVPLILLTFIIGRPFREAFNSFLFAWS